jgi:methylthioribose-1-phosphate isomerase
MRTIWPGADGRTVEIIDQTKLPHELVISRLATVADAARAIGTMQVRGAPLIGAAAAYGVALAVAEDPSDDGLAAATAELAATRPTAVNLRWALAEMKCALQAPGAPAHLALCSSTGEIAGADVAVNAPSGARVALTADIWRHKGGGAAPVDVLTHCNAGWLATVDWGTALAPVYRAHDAGIPVHVWVDETRPRNQGAGLTAWELAEHGVAHTVIVDNAAGHVMREGLVDLCIVGTDRTTAGGDVANKIGTYTKALAARDNDIPFYVALPSPTIDWEIESGAAIPIEQRDSREVTHVEGWTEDGRRIAVRLTPAGSAAVNYAFDVTPARLVTGLITERGICPASRLGLLELFPERGEATSRPTGKPRRMTARHHSQDPDHVIIGSGILELAAWLGQISASCAVSARPPYQPRGTRQLLRSHVRVRLQPAAWRRGSQRLPFRVSEHFLARREG